MREFGGSKGSDSRDSRRDGGKAIAGRSGEGAGSRSSGSANRERRLSAVGSCGTGYGEAERRQLVYTRSPSMSGGDKPGGLLCSTVVSGQRGKSDEGL